MKKTDNSKTSLLFYVLLLTVSMSLIAGYLLWLLPAQAQSATLTRRVNAPYTSEAEGNVPVEERAILWFGEVGPTDDNYADVRVIYNDEKLYVTLHILDRLLFYDDTSPSVADLTEWDSATLYLDLNGNVGSAPGTSAHRFIGQLNVEDPPREYREDYQAAYQGNGSGWVMASTTFSTTTGWRGAGYNNTAEDSGWNMTFRIPFDSLGLTQKPAEGTTWGMAIVLHDRDDAAGSPIPDKYWPEGMDSDTPSTWGQIRFGWPTYTPPSAAPGAIYTIRHGVNGATVVDGHVGGDTTCAGESPPFWPTWGSLNYDGDHEVNIQNQWDVADWACFSKYYVTFPLDSLPANQVVISATLTMYHFGNSLPDQAEPSLIQVLTVGEDWDEATITWNNAPLAVENIGRTWVDPLPLGPPYPNIPIEWDVSLAVAEAYEAGEPLRLVLYSADSARHSGKYFRSSDSGSSTVRPNLDVLMGIDDGFTMTVDQPVQSVAPGDTAVFTINIQPTGNFTSDVTLSFDNPYNTGDLSAGLTPTTISNASGQATLTLTDGHNPSFSSGILYSVPITATGGGIMHTTNVYMLVNGSQIYLPSVRKDS